MPVAKEPEQPVAPMPGTTVPHMPGKPDMPVAEPIRIESLEEAIKAQEQRRKEQEENLKKGKVLRIIKIKKDIDKRQKQKIASAIIAGISFSAFVIAALTSADDLQRLLHLEITNIASLREYVETIPTGILASLAVLALSISNYLGCKEFQDFDKKILKQYEDELNESPSKGLQVNRMFEKNNILTLADNNEYLVLDKFNYNNITYVYLVDINDNTNIIYGKLNGEDIVELSDLEELEIIIRKVNENLKSSN